MVVGGRQVRTVASFAQRISGGCEEISNCQEPGPMLSWQRELNSERPWQISHLPF